MGTWDRRDPSNSCTKQSSPKSCPASWWTNTHRTWCCDRSSVGCWRVWILHCSAYCLRMYHDEKMSPEYMSCWNSHTGKRRLLILRRGQLRERDFLSVIRNFKIQRRGRQRERHKNNRFNKQNNNFARASHFFVHFFPVFARLRRENT